MQQRYSSIETISSSFIFTSKGLGIEQVEKGVLWLKKPALMRWEYSYPEEKLFVADGKEGFLYEPEDRKVTVQSLTTEELLCTPLKFLFGAGDVEENFHIVPENEFRPTVERSQVIRLIPKTESDYSFLVLEIDDESSDLVRLTFQDPGGDMREYVFADIKLDVKVDKKKFRFKPPDGVEVDRY